MHTQIKSSGCSSNCQVLEAYFGQEIRSLTLPPPTVEVMPGVTWGEYAALCTPAFWASRIWLLAETNTPSAFRLGETLEEEVVACLLGGHGLPAAVGMAAYDRIRLAGLCHSTPPAEEIESLLRQPLLVHGRSIHYRFPKQRASFVARSLQIIHESIIPTDDLELRDFLATLPGIGLKTASWVTRNYCASDRVAIIDIHIQRAGVLAGFFPHYWNPARHYHEMESSFINFASAIGARPCLLDNLMWDEMRSFGRHASSLDEAVVAA